MQKEIPEAAVVATKPIKNQPAIHTLASKVVLTLVFILMILAEPGLAKVLPEDRVDVLYHSYSGGGITINGPSILVRKAYKDKISIWGNYYADMISGASIDVQANASKYTETRTEFSLGADYLVDRTLLGIGFTRSTEDDYDANTINASVSQDFFGDLTTLSFGYAYGDDEVRRNGDDEFSDQATHQSYHIEISQILSKNWVFNLSYEAIADEGFLNNPYRSIRFLDDSVAQGFSYQTEIYPRTRTSDAVAARTMYYLPYRAALRGEYRNYSDSWGIKAQNIEISYTHPWRERWVFDFNFRIYDQTSADFYADIFPFQNAQNFLARDKELASYDNISVGLGISYQFNKQPFLIFSSGTINLNIDYLQFQYEDFSNVLKGQALGSEPLYELDVVVTRAFISLFF
ncbi:MAG: DUF3570 domain-containing protein [Pseudomonadales bacterium]|nr:DUF3570 domain-containing protein [Pseudomonadales bacterium]